METQSFRWILMLMLLPLVAGHTGCNIDSAGVKTYSTSDGLVINRVGVVATFRLGCPNGLEAPLLHAETAEGQYLAVSSSSLKPDFKSVSFVEDLNKSKSRWIEIRVYDDETYQRLLVARRTEDTSGGYNLTPMKTISVSHSGVSGGPFVKMETIATLGLIATFFFAHTLRSKIVNAK